jgi:uncharacterized protein
MLTRLRHIFGIILLSVVSFSFAAAQSDSKHPNSPVFKDYREARPTPLLIESDVTYRLWQTFLLERQANAGDMLAQHELGIRYLTGRGTGADTVKGAYWIHKAAIQKLTSAQFNMGILYYHGWGVEWNPFDAYTQFRAAALKGMVEAEFVMGQFYTDNLVIERDWKEAYRWVKLAADSGYAPAKESLKEFERRLASVMSDSSVVSKKDSANAVVFLDFGKDTTQRQELHVLKSVLESGGEEVRKALGLASMLEGSMEIDSTELEAIRKTAEDGSPEALAVLGRCYERGLLLKKDLIQAAELYIRAIRLDSPRGSEPLWQLLQSDNFLAQLKARSAANDTRAHYVWAMLRVLGFDGILQSKQAWISDDQALRLMERAAAKDHVPAMVELGNCYYSGRWVAQDHQRAVAHWEKGLALGSADARVRVAIMNVREEKSAAVVGRSVEELEEALKNGSVLAQVALGYCYEKGIGVPLEKGEAASLYRGAAQRGSQDAFRALKRLHDELRPSGKEFHIEE